MDGYDLAARLATLAAANPLDPRRPASDLLYRLAGDCPAVRTPLPPEGYRTGDTTAPAPLRPPGIPGFGATPPISPSP